MTCVHEYDVIGVVGTWTCSVIYVHQYIMVGVLCVCALGVQEGGVTSASSSVSGGEVSGGEISCFMVANGWSSQCLVQ